MLLSLLTIISGLAWLMIETDFLTIRLPCGKSPNRTPAMLLLPAGETVKMSLPMPKSWDTFTPCELETEQPENIKDTVIILAGE